MDPTTVPAVEAERQQREARSGRPAHLRITTPDETTTVRETVARMKAPGPGASLKDVTDVLYAAPLGRHGFRDVPSTLVNLRAHRETFVEVPVGVSA